MNTNELTREELIKRHDYLVKKHNTTNNEKKCIKYRELIKSYKNQIKSK